MAFPTKTQLPIAISKRSQFPLSAQHLTTSNFLQFQVSKMLELVPTQSVNIEHECFSRLKPLPVPTFGRANIIHRVFFVPNRTIFPAWNDFITDNKHVYSNGTPTVVTMVPKLTNWDFVQAFIDPDQEFTRNTDGVPDFTYVNYNLNNITNGIAAQNSMTPREFTPLGKFAYKLLRALGIKINWTNADTEPISLMPLFAAMRIFADYFYPSQYVQDGDCSFLMRFLIYDYNASNPMNISNLRRVFKIMYRIPYAADYFTAAWDNPTAPTTGASSEIKIKDTTLPDDSIPGVTDTYVSSRNVDGTYNGTAVIDDGNSPAGGVNSISQFAINALHALSDYLKRHQIAGARNLDRFFARFGVKLPDEKINRCYMLGEYKQDIQFGEVISTASTEGSELGNYAGKGISYGQGNTSYTAEEYGFLIIVSSVVPLPQYYQGKHRSSMHLTRLDFWTPEFDNLGTQGISSKELFVPDTPVLYPVDYQNRVFGFIPRYAEYKVPYSQITGDLSLARYKTTNDSWTLFRDVEPLYYESDTQVDYDVEHSKDFVMSTDSDQYNRIFYSTNDETDKFVIIHNFNISTNFPGKSLFDSYEFETSDKAQNVTLGIGGTNVNV